MVKFPWIEKALGKFGAPMFNSVIDPVHFGMTGIKALEVRCIACGGGAITLVSLGA